MDCQKCCQQLNASGFEVRDHPTRWDYVLTRNVSKHVELSSDPGSFLCGYTTALSLKCANKARQNVAKRPIPVVFFHVSCHWLLSVALANPSHCTDTLPEGEQSCFAVFHGRVDPCCPGTVYNDCSTSPKREVMTALDR